MRTRAASAACALLVALLPGCTNTSQHVQAAPVAASAPAGLGQFAEHGDIGVTAHKGGVVYDPATGRYRVTGSGANIWGSEDAFHYVWTRRSGDLHIAADVEWIGQGTDPHRKAGVMIRQNLTPGSPYADVMVHGDGLIALQYREEQNGPTRQIVSNLNSANPRIRLEREGDYVFFSIPGAGGELSHGGGNYRIKFDQPYYVGLAVSAHNNDLSETAVSPTLR